MIVIFLAILGETSQEINETLIIVYGDNVLKKTAISKLQDLDKL